MLRSFVWEVSSRVGFCPFPLLSEYICYNRKLNINLNFMCHMYDKKFISVTSHALDPSPVTNCHTLSDPRPLKRDVLYGWPPFQANFRKISIFSGNFKKISNFQAKIGYLQLFLGKLFYFSSKVTTFEHTSCQRRRLVINIGGQKFGSQILGRQTVLENIVSDNILKKISKASFYSQKFLMTFFLVIENFFKKCTPFIQS